jgi:hypothetical protein
MKTTVEMAKEAGFTWEPINNIIGPLKRFEALVRADEREQALAQPAPVQEPVFCEYCGGNDDADFGLPTDHCTDCARPQPAAQPAAPLTDEQIESLLPDDDTPMSLGEAFVKFARLVEAAHGIKKGQQ